MRAAICIAALLCAPGLALAQAGTGIGWTEKPAFGRIGYETVDLPGLHKLIALGGRSRRHQLDLNPCLREIALGLRHIERQHVEDRQHGDPQGARLAGCAAGGEEYHQHTYDHPDLGSQRVTFPGTCCPAPTHVPAI